MEIPSKYDPSGTEDRWYSYWMEHGYFHSEPDDREAYTIVIPPPNVTGVLHMGHMLNNTIQDVLIRRARMMGKNACWVPGTDHASIATEAKVVRKLRESGIKKSDLSREAFLEHAFAWKEEYGGIILEQLKKLGASCDWERTRFTMDETYYAQVIDTFIKLHEDGLIYRGKRMINWDPAAKTALSDEEVIYREVNGKLYHVRYQVSGTDEWLTIATTRPETILGDSAICIHPEDERYVHLHGKKAIVPMVNREVPIILDDYVDREFGTGCLKVTPAHDVNDWDLGVKHDLEVIDIMHADGTLSEAAQFYVGEDRFDVRKQIAKDLEASGHLVKAEDYTNKVGFSERTDVVIEPRLSQQWWVSMEQLAKPALELVESGDIKFHPEKFVNTYRHWMTNIKDWCISRQLWWGHRIPAWYWNEDETSFVVAKTPEEALAKIHALGATDVSLDQLRQDEDVMDTWFSSWLWPISVFDGLYKEGEVDYYYPTSDLVTGPDIIFFWVARMIMAGHYYRGEKCFSNVYFTGIVRDKQGRKMSKSLGNSPDPLELIQAYGADGVRAGLLLTAPAGNDLPFDPKLCEQGRNFSNKVWNAFRLIRGWEVREGEQPEVARTAIRWFEARMAEVIDEIDQSFERFRLSEALMSTYKLIWDDFCSWYLELVKPPFGEPIDATTLAATMDFLGDVLKLVHPFMPFLSEEIWQHMDERKPEDALLISPWPKAGKRAPELLAAFETSAACVGSIRNIRKSNNLPQKDAIELMVRLNDGNDQVLSDVVVKLGNVASFISVDEKPEQAFSFMVNRNEFFVPFGDHVDLEAEREKLEKELEYTQGFMASVQKKLSNDRFVNNAPEQVVANERKKLEDAENKVQLLREKLSEL